jgi:acid phosphatase family membrane protein YuiD
MDAIKQAIGTMVREETVGLVGSERAARIAGTTYQFIRERRRDITDVNKATTIVTTAFKAGGMPLSHADAVIAARILYHAGDSATAIGRIRGTIGGIFS